MALFNKQKKTESNGVEDFAYLIRIYFQSVLAAKLGISNLAILRDLRLFKQTLRIPTENNKLGIAEKRECKKILMNEYHLTDSFFSAIDNSIKKNVRNINQMQEYLSRFQVFTQNMLTVITTQLSWKLRIPAFFKRTLFSVIDQGIDNIFEKDNIKDISTYNAIIELRKLSNKLELDKDWCKQYLSNVIYWAKKDAKQRQSDANE